MSKYMNPIKAVSIQLCDEPFLKIHCDGRVTASDKLKPEETAKLALDELKKQWLNDAQAVKIRELKAQIERLDEWKQSALEVEREWDANAVATMLGAKLGESQRKVIQREVPLLLERIKRLEDELMDTKNKYAVLVADVVLNEDRAERIKRLEDRIHRAAMAFFRDGSDGQVASGMLAILEEERGKP